VLFVGDDWVEAHHDVEIVDEDGRRLAKRRLPEGIEGLAALHGLVADHLEEDAEPVEVLIGIETDRGPWVQALIASGYTVYAVNPLQVARYRERHGVSGAKSDPGDAHILAELVRLDRAHHRPVAGDSALAGHVKVLARTHQSLIWSRQRQTNALRSMLREFYPGALAAVEELAGRDALAVLAIAPSPEAGRRLSISKITATLRRGRAATQPRHDRGPDPDRPAGPGSSGPIPGWSAPTPPRSARWSPSSPSWWPRPRCCRRRWRRVWPAPGR
jgi:transposase